MGPKTKLFGLVVAALLLLFAASAVALRFILTADRIKAWVIPKAESALGRKVQLADAGLSFWPPFGVYVEGLSVANRPGFSEEPLFGAGRAQVQLALWPLIGGNIVFDDIELEDLTFTYVVVNDSLSNISDLLTGEGVLPQILFERFRLDRLHVRYRNRMLGTAMDLDSLDVEAMLDPKDRGFTMALDLPHWLWHDSNGDIESHDPVQLKVTGALGADMKVLTLTALDGSLSGLPMAGHGELGTREGRTKAAFEIKLGPIELEDLTKRLPEARRAALADYALSGSLSGQLKLRYDAAADAGPEVEGEIVWLQGEIDRRGKQIARFASLSLPIDPRGLHVSADQLIVLSGPMQVAVVGTPWPPEKFEVTVSGTADLAAVSGQLETQAYGGRLAYAFSGTGSGVDPAEWTVRIRLNPENVEFRQSGRASLFVNGGAVIYDGHQAELRSVDIRSGPTRATINGRAVSLPWQDLWADSARSWSPEVRLDLVSPYADLDRFFPEMAPDTARPREESAVPVLPRLTATVGLEADTLVVCGTQWTRMKGELSYRDGRLAIDTLYGMVYGGRAAISGSVDLRNPAMPAYDLSASADSVEVGSVLSRFARVGQFLGGRSTLSARIKGSGTEPKDLVSQLTVAGTAALLDARLVRLDAAGSIMGLIGMEKRDTVSLRSLRNSFSVERGRVRLDDFAFAALESNWTLTGSAGFDGTLDYRIGTRLSRSLSDSFRLPAELKSRLSGDWLSGADPVGLLKDDSGHVELYLQLSGSYDKPSVSFDWARLEPAIKARFKTRVLDRLSKEAQEKAKTGLGNLFQKLKP